MRVTIVGRHIAVTPALRRYVASRLKVLERFGAERATAHVILSVEKFRHTAEIVLTHRGNVIQGKVASTEMYGSLDRVADRIRRQLLKRKERLVNHKPRAARRSARSEQES
ncbi:MAG TPA: ribosome-associated translation inhibitor RaiA [Nitrospirales bacterium]|nr:ribosome-associated translation inhibitor RaiA [Nitrospirales bacterium]